jgi:Flp pilus assembly protein TadD
MSIVCLLFVFFAVPLLLYGQFVFFQDVQPPVLKGKPLRLLTAGLVVLSANNAQSQENVLKEANAFYQKGNVEAAIEDYRAYLEIHPEAFEVRSNLGAALARLGRFDQAIAEYRGALALAPDNPGIIANLGLAYYKTGKLAEAAQQWSKAHALYPANRQITMLLADAASHLGDHSQVIALLGPPSGIDPQDLGAAYLLGTSLIAAHRPSDAQALVALVLRRGDSAEARILEGTLELQRGDSSAAVADLERATQMDPKLPNVFSAYGSALLSIGETGRAEAAFRRELESNPNDFLTHLDLGFLLKQNQQYDEALVHLLRALELRPGDIAVRYQIASIHLLTGDLNAAVGELESITHDSPRFIAADVSLTTAYYRLKRKADGDRERALVQKLNAEEQSDAEPALAHPQP